MARACECQRQVAASLVHSIDRLHCVGAVSHPELAAGFATEQLVVLGAISPPWVLFLAAAKHRDQPIAVAETV